MDGWVKIGTELDTKSFDSQIDQLAGKISVAEKEHKMLNNEIEETETALAIANREYAIMEEKLMEIETQLVKIDQTIKGFDDNSGRLTVAQSEVYSQFDNLLDLQKELNEKIAIPEKKVAKLNKQLEKQTLSQQKLNDKTDEYKNKIELINMKNHAKEIDSIKGKTGGVIKKVAKWGLAVFGIRSIYMGIRRAISSVRAENEQVNASFKAIESFFTSIFEPVVIRIVGWMTRLIQYVNYLAKAWFGVDLLAKSNEKALKGANKQAKELRKTLSGFDEMNVINDSGGTSGVGIGALPIPEDFPVPKWLEWIKDNGDLITGVLFGVAGGLLAIKTGVGLIKGLGIGLIIFGTIELIGDLMDYFDKLDSSLGDNGTSWEDFGKIVTDIGLIILGVGILTGNLPLIIAGAAALAVGLILQNWREIKGVIENILKWLDGKLGWVEDRFGLLGEFITSPIKIAISKITTTFEGLFKSAKLIFDGILLIFKGDFKGGLISIGKGIVNGIITLLNGMISGINMITIPFRSLIVAFGKVSGKNWTMNNVQIPTIKYLKTGGIINNPNHGVPVGGGVRGGESGSEGVIPLTDSQAMETLGNAIGKYITINANIPVNMNGRTISREIKKVNTNDNFVMNR